MPATPDYLKRWRQRRTEEGKCHRCPRPATAYLCPQCQRETSAPARQIMRQARATQAFLELFLHLLPAQKCATCHQPKDRFHPLHCRRCLRTSHLSHGTIRYGASSRESHHVSG